MRKAFPFRSILSTRILTSFLLRYQTHLWESYSNGKVSDEDGKLVVRTDGGDPAFNQRVLMFLRGQPVNSPLPNGWHDYITSTGLGIDSSLFNDGRSDQTQLFVFTPGESISNLRFQAHYGEKSEAVDTIQDIINARKATVRITPWKSVV